MCTMPGTGSTNCSCMADMPPRLVYRARYYDAISFNKALA